MKLRLLRIFAFLAVAAAVGFWGPDLILELKNGVGEFKDGSILRIGEKKIHVEIVDTPPEMAKGLSERDFISDNEGMLFVFGAPRRYSFWMKGMNFAIDIIWIGEEKRVVDITRDLKPESYPNHYMPKVPAIYVLEVNSGWAERYNVEIGDEVALPKM